MGKPKITAGNVYFRDDPFNAVNAWVYTIVIDGVFLEPINLPFISAQAAKDAMRTMVYKLTL